MTTTLIGAHQTTLGREIILSGIGVHSGAPTTLILQPAEPDTGIRFLVTEGEKILAEIPATHTHLINGSLCTILGDHTGRTVATVEHLLSALRGLSVDNALVEINGGEVPIMDGSARDFVEAILEAGIVSQKGAPRHYLKVLKTVRVEDGGAFAELRPYNGFQVDVEIDYDTPLIGRQRLRMDINPGVYRDQLARARTFGFMKDVETLWAHGRALGASLENTIALDDDRILNCEGLRYEDEFVRHKIIDAIGDLALVGMPILGAFRSYRGGHRLNHLVLEAMFADEESWTTVRAPYQPDRGHAELPVGVGAVSFAANRN